MEAAYVMFVGSKVHSVDMKFSDMKDDIVRRTLNRMLNPNSYFVPNSYETFVKQRCLNQELVRAKRKNLNKIDSDTKKMLHRIITVKTINGLINAIRCAFFNTIIREVTKS